MKSNKMKITFLTTFAVMLIAPFGINEVEITKNCITLSNHGNIAETTETPPGDNDLQLSPAGTQSGPVTNVPWEKDEKFLESQSRNNTPVLMAAYHTVLHDPLPGEEENVHLAARYLAGTVVKPGEVFHKTIPSGHI